MERLWAPWRMEYILKCRQPGCFLCDAFQSATDREHLRECALSLKGIEVNQEGWR